MARNTSVTLGEHFNKFVAENISLGRFQSASEVIRAGLRKLEENEAKLQTLRNRLQAGEDSPLVYKLVSDNFISELHNKHLE